MSHAFDDDEIANLTDDDIQNILWPIILRARESPGAPFGPGLFAAYDSYVEDNRLPEVDSQKYFRFLVRMVAGRTATESLAGRFKRLLAEHSINVDFDSEILSPEERTQEDEEQDDTADEERESTEDDVASQQHRRRVSVSSSRGAESWKTGEQLDGGSDFARHRRATRSSSRASDPTGTRKRRSDSSRRRLLEQLPVRGRVNTRSFSDHPYNPRRAHSASVSSQGSLRIGRGARLRGDNPSRRTLQAPVDSDAVIRRFLDDYEYYPSETQLLADADTMRHHSGTRLVRDLLRRWHEQTVFTASQRDAQAQRARNIVDANLMNETFRIWNDKYRERRLEKDLDRFWAVQEHQAQAKWEMHLMEKAFVHWATTTQEHVERTAVARRHVLRSKYFNAWKELTAVNELKVERFRKRRIFDRWRRLLHNTLDNEDTAVAVYEQTLVRRVFLQCLWHYRDNVAGYWAEDKIRKRFFYRWREIVRHIRQREAMILQIHQHDVQSRLIHTWQSRLNAFRGHEASAESFHRRKLLSSATESFRLYSKLSRPLRQISEKINTRVARSMLQLWALRANQSRQAAQIDKMRLMRNALTTWDDELRCAWLQHRIDDRLAIESLYKLSIASKASMHTRLRDYKLLSQCLDRWQALAGQRSTDLDQAYARFEQRRRQINLQYAWNRLRSRFLFYQDDEQAATSHCYFSTVPRAFHHWREGAQAVRRLGEQADAARYYFLLTDTIRRWRNATYESQRLRRREAYSTVRRMCKTNLGRRTFATWRARTATVQEMSQVASERAEDLVLAGLAKTFGMWHSRSSLISQCLQQADSSRQRHLASASMTRLQLQLARCDQLNSRALPFKTELAAVSAQKAFTRLGRRLFWLRRRDDDAVALREKHWQSHVRSILRYWAERAASMHLRRSGASDHVPGLAPLDARGKGADVVMNEEERASDQYHVPPDQSMIMAEEWSAYDEPTLDLIRSRLNLDLIPEASTEDLEGVITSTPLPGYLRTPSRRTAARSKARNRLLTLSSNQAGVTTPGRGPTQASDDFGRAATAPPVAGGRDLLADVAMGITPFQQRLRAQGFGSVGSGASTSRRSGRRAGETGSLLEGVGEGSFGFEDIPEDRSIEDGREE